MTRPVPDLLLRLIAWPIPPAALRWVLLTLVLTVAAVLLARVHSFAGVVAAGAVAALATSGLRTILRR
jgi:hypothetical protein